MAALGSTAAHALMRYKDWVKLQIGFVPPLTSKAARNRPATFFGLHYSNNRADAQCPLRCRWRSAEGPPISDIVGVLA